MAWIYSQGSQDDQLGQSSREALLVDRLRVAEAEVRRLRKNLAAKDGNSRKEVKGNKDEVIHLALVCAGHNAIRAVSTLVKSILFYNKQRSVIHFDFVTDQNVTQPILETLFQTWKLKRVLVSYHSYHNIIHDVSWIMTTHYSGIFGLMKLALNKVLPQDVKRVIVLDTDIVLASDISELWKVFDEFDPDNAFGLVENQSDWYVPGSQWKDHNPWPAIGNGFNTGVILADLGRLVEVNWSRMWRLAAEKELVTLFSTQLADQDVINAVIKQRPELVHRLPCQWNLQVTQHSLLEMCPNHSDPHLIHFNSPQKQKGGAARHLDLKSLRNHYLTFKHYDGNLLRRESAVMLDGGELREQDLNSGEDDEDCSEWRTAKNIEYRTHLYFLKFDIKEEKVSDDDVTFVAQLSFDRKHMVELLLEQWEGPVSLALYLTDAEAAHFEDFALNSQILSKRTNVGYHVVYKEGNFHPVNHLRNVALDNVRTPYAFLADIDFLPGKEVYRNLRMSVSQQFQRGPDGELPNRALIVPAFETPKYRLDKFPKSKPEVVHLLDLGVLFTFRFDVWGRGHRATDYGKWKAATMPYKVSWESDFEPYFVMPVRSRPKYDERFVGFGWNKVSHAMEMVAMGAEFVVLPQAFAVHMPHAPSGDIVRYRSSKKYRECLQSLKEEFVQDLNNKYGTSFVVEESPSKMLMY